MTTTSKCPQIKPILTDSMATNFNVQKNPRKALQSTAATLFICRVKRANQSAIGRITVAGDWNRRNILHQNMDPAPFPRQTKISLVAGPSQPHPTMKVLTTKRGCFRLYLRHLMWFDWWMGSGRSEVEGVGIVHSRQLSVFTTPPLAAGSSRTSGF